MRRALLANERAAITCSSSAVRNSVLAHLARERVTAQHCCHIASETAPLAARGAAAATHLVCFGSATRPEMGARRRWYGSETRRAPAAAAGERTCTEAAFAAWRQENPVRCLRGLVRLRRRGAHVQRKLPYPATMLHATSAPSGVHHDVGQGVRNALRAFAPAHPAPLRSVDHVASELAVASNAAPSRSCWHEISARPV